MSRNLPLAALLALGLARPAPGAAPPAPPPWKPSVERLIRQLGAPSFRAREEAERRLRADNVRIVPLLRKALGSPNPEVRKRALRLIPVLEDAALFAPRRVTLKVTGKPLKTILDEITKQTGYKFYYWGGGGPSDSHSCDFKDVTFWEAIDRLCRDAKLNVQPSYGDDSLRLQPGGYAPHATRAGPFRFVANNFQMYRNLDFGLAGAGTPPPARHETLTLNFTIYAEPRLPFLGMGDVRLESAYDSEGNSMLVPVPASGGPAESEGRFSRRYYGGGSRQFTMSASVNLARPSPKASALKRLRGKVPVTVLVEQKPVVVTDKVLSAKGKKFTAGKTTFHFEDVVKQANGQYQLKLRVQHDDKDNPGDYTWMNNLYQRIELRDARGNKYNNWGSSWGSSGANQVNMNLTYSAGGAKFGPPARFIYQTWKTRQHEVTFEFKDLPLP